MNESDSCQETAERIDAVVKDVLEAPSISVSSVMSEEVQEELSKAISSLSFNPVVPEEVQEELSKAISSLRRVKRCMLAAQRRKNEVNQAQFADIAEGLTSAIAELKQDPRKLLFVRRFRRDAQFAMRELTNPLFGRLINAFKYVLYESSTPVKVLLGLLVGLPMYMLVSFMPYRPVIETFLKPVTVASETCEARNLREAQTSTQGTQTTPQGKTPNPNTKLMITQCDVDMAVVALILCGSAGFLGSIISILTRIKEFENERYADAILPVYIGAFKPLIGSTFGILVFALLSADILPIKLDQDKGKIQQWYALYTIAFVAGFSERLVKDIISQAENRVLPSHPLVTVYPLGQSASPPANLSGNQSGSGVGTQPVANGRTGKI